MLTAIIAAIVAVAVVACVVLLIYILRGRKKRANLVSDDEIEHIDTYGVGTPSVKGLGHEAPSAQGVHVKTSRELLAKPAERLSGRFGVLGVFIAGVFAVLSAKLWSMQLLSNDGYASEAEENFYTTVTLPAPRGCIYDRNGVALVKNRVSQTVVADPDAADNANLLKRLSAVLGIPEGVVRQKIKDESQGAQNRRVVASGASLRDVAFISEHADAFPGIAIEQRTVREYPYGALGSHALGYTSTPSKEDLEQKDAGRDIESTDTVGKTGLEYSYDRILAGDKGTRRMVVDASGNVISIVAETEPKKGSDIHLTIDSYAQYVTDKLLAQTVAPDGVIGTGKGVSASVVALDVTDGSVVVMSNYPTFDPSYLVDGIPADIWELYNTDESHAPFLNRAINGQYAPASTFKAFTSLAGLNYGFATYGSTWNCSGKWDGFGSGDVQKCWEESGHGTLDLHTGIVVSCDTVFYDIAKSFYDHGPEGTGELSETALQEYLELYRFGQTTGIDLSGESSGVIPTPEWKAEQWRNVPAEAMWRGGDYTNMIIGQGNVLVTPMQLVCAYGAIATGKIMRPHLLKEVYNSEGEVVTSVEAEVIAEPSVNADHLSYVRNALHAMVSGHPDLEAEFVSRGLDVAAKSGTAEHTDRKDDAWFAAYAPFDNPKYAAVCIVEQGGSGSEVAGPIVAKVLSALLDNNRPGPGEGLGYVEGATGHAVDVQFSGNAARQD